MLAAYCCERSGSPWPFLLEKYKALKQVAGRWEVWWIEVGVGRPHTCAGSSVQVVPVKNASIFIIKDEQEGSDSAEGENM